MAYASRAGRARVSSSNPQALAVCDRCGIWYNHKDLNWQYDWRGASLANLRLLVCRHCLDTPQSQLRAIVLPADPVPIVQPRTEAFLRDETTYMALAGFTTDPVTGIPIRNANPTVMGTVTGVPMEPMPVGAPEGLTQSAVMPLATLDGVPTQFRVPLDLLSVVANGTDQIQVTCSTPHNLSDLDQIAVEGLADTKADGFFSVTVLSATAFTYQTIDLVGTGNLLTPTTLMVTCLVGLPYAP